MALTGMQIYKSLPKTNCKDCGLPTCMAFAMQVAAKQRSLSDCPHISDEASDTLSEASAPPIKLVKMGSDKKSFELGQETVMFRHEEKFHRASGIAILVPGDSSDGDAAEWRRAGLRAFAGGQPPVWRSAPRRTLDHRRGAEQQRRSDGTCRGNGQAVRQRGQRE